MLQQEGVPPELKGQVGHFVDALADPAKRPEIVAELRHVDPKIARQEDLLMPYLQLQQYDLAFDIMNASLDRDRLAWLRDWDIMHAWSAENAAFRRDPRFPGLADRVGLLDYWKQYGFPDGCHAGGDVAVVCS